MPVFDLFVPRVFVHREHEPDHIVPVLMPESRIKFNSKIIAQFFIDSLKNGGLIVRLSNQLETRWHD